ncbi:MAG TPA: hypothetical protein VFX28_09335, partial [Methylomirabilota bacterium]|nr:hypothetical protein [Methylomirabilota bacterium]
MPAPDFVAVGHVTLDRFGDAVRPGGSALYAAVVADRLGLSAGILTSHGDDFPLGQVPSRIEVVSVPAARTTAFEHRRADAGRALRVTAAAAPLTAADLPDDWKDAPVVLLAPVLGEVDPLLAPAFPDASLGASVQGWLRGVDREGAVGPLRWTPPPFLLGRLQALFL